MSEVLKKFKFAILYLIAIIAIVYGGIVGNLISLALGVFMLAWIVLLRFKAGRTDEEAEGEMEVNEENENQTDE